MRCTVKCIVKFGLIAEVLTAIIGHIGEFALRYHAYSMAFDDLFGNDTPGLESTGNKVIIHHHQNYLNQKNSKWTRMISTTSTTTSSPFVDTAEPKSSSIFSTIVGHLFDPINSSINNLFGNAEPKTFSHSRMDWRPMIVCSIIVCLHLIFVVGIVFEWLPVICALTITWLLYLILILLILYAGTGSGVHTLTYAPTSTTSAWSTLTPSPFTILVMSIILVFSLILIAMIVEERRQVAIRIRAKSAAIPLVRSRDMDLDDI